MDGNPRWGSLTYWQLCMSVAQLNGCLFTRMLRSGVLLAHLEHSNKSFKDEWRFTERICSVQADTYGKFFIGMKARIRLTRCRPEGEGD